MIGKTILHYRITGKLGEGGMGVVFRAQDTRLRRDVAIKFLPRQLAAVPASRRRFEIEARAAAALNHPNIAHIYSVEEADGEMFIVMECIDGHELRTLVGDDRLSLERAMDIATQIARGLKAAHDKGIVHRDIKSANIMVTDEGQVKITDFGLAKVRGDTRLTRTGTTVGTADYMSPEQVRGEEVDERTDIWSFGVVLYEMLTGQRPFKGDYEQALMYAIVNEDARRPSAVAPGLPPEADRLVVKALARNRDERFRRMDDVLDDLKSLTAVVAGEDSGSHGARKDIAGNARPDLAVLPFSSIKHDPEMEFLGFALADQIISVLTCAGSILVRPSSAVRKYQQQGVDAPTAGRELQVDYVLNGYYLKEADTIRLNVELVSTRSNAMVWRDSIEVRYENAFKLQDVVSEKVLRGMNVQFSREDRDRMQPDVPKDPAAYEYYLRAVAYPVTLDGNQLAIKMLNESISRDSTYAPAWAELGFRTSQVAIESMQGMEGLRKAEEALLKALSLNGSLLPALWDLSVHYVNVGKSEEAVRIIERMFSASSNSAMAHYALGYLYRYVGMLEESARQVEKARTLDPKNPRFRSGGLTFIYLGDYKKALEMFDLDRGGSVSIAWRGMALFLTGDKQRAIEHFDRLIAMEPESFVGLRHATIRAYLVGRPDEGLRLLRRLEEMISSETDSEHWYLMGNACSLLGDSAGCLRALRRAIDGGFFNYPAMLTDPLLDPVREDPGFRQLLLLAREKHEEFKRSYAPRLAALPA